MQAVSTAKPDLFSPSEWGKADFTVGSAKLQTPDALNADVNKESCIVTVSWAPVANAVSYLYKIDDGEEVPVSEPEISFSLFDYAPGEHSVSVKALDRRRCSDRTQCERQGGDSGGIVRLERGVHLHHHRRTAARHAGQQAARPCTLGRLLPQRRLPAAWRQRAEHGTGGCLHRHRLLRRRHETDQSDYTRPLTEGGPVLGSTVHGYVVSLTHAPTRWYYAEDRTYDDWGYWEYHGLDARACNATSYQDPWDFGNLVLAADLETRRKHVVMYMGTSDSEDDFNGYYNCMAMLEYIAAANHDCCEYPPLTLAINYGKKELWMERDI